MIAAGAQKLMQTNATHAEHDYTKKRRFSLRCCLRWRVSCRKLNLRRCARRSLCAAAAAAADSCQFLQLECSKSADPIIGRRTCVNKQQSRHPERYSQAQHNRDEAEKGGSRSIRKWDWALLEPFIEQKRRRRRRRCFNMTKSLMRVCMSERVVIIKTKQTRPINSGLDFNYSIHCVCCCCTRAERWKGRREKEREIAGHYTSLPCGPAHT